jgi:hypothetical protein
MKDEEDHRADSSFILSIMEETIMRGRHPSGPEYVDVKHLHGSAQAKERLRVILETMMGKWRVGEACERLSICEQRFRQLREELVRPPRIELENETLFLRHLHAVLLAEFAKESAAQKGSTLNSIGQLLSPARPDSAVTPLDEFLNQLPAKITVNALLERLRMQGPNALYPSQPYRTRRSSAPWLRRPYTHLRPPRVSCPRQGCDPKLAWGPYAGQVLVGLREHDRQPTLGHANVHE